MSDDERAAALLAEGRRVRGASSPAWGWNRCLTDEEVAVLQRVLSRWFGLGGTTEGGATPAPGSDDDG